MKGNYLDWKALGFSLGIFSAFYLGLSALFAMTGIEFAWFTKAGFELLHSLLPMLTASWEGVLIGLGFGLMCGVICGSILGLLYNAFFSLRQNLKFADKLGRIVLGVILLFAGDYASGIVGGIIFLIGCIAIAEAIFGYCYLVQLFK